MQIKSYQELTIECWQQPQEPNKIVRQAARLTQHAKADLQLVDTNNIEGLLKFLFKAEHTSLVEHLSWTFYIEGVSRSFLAQITRHRIGSFTSASQHYTDYRDMPFIVHPTLTKNEVVYQCLFTAVTGYKLLVDDGVPIEEARQVLPNAAEVRLLWTVNARSLYNFFEQRWCGRNVAEMLAFCEHLYAKVQDTWPEFAKFLGPYCYHLNSKCNQGKMTCGRPWIYDD